MDTSRLLDGLLGVSPMGYFILFAIVFYAFIGLAPKEVVQILLASTWLIMILVTIYVFLDGVIVWMFN